jgi:hypothetical protein
MAAKTKWVDRYEDLGPYPTLERAYREQDQDKLTQASILIANSQELVSLVGTNRLLTVLIPAKDNSARTLHNLQVLGSDSFRPGNERIIGIFGSRASAPFQILPTQEMTETLLQPDERRFRVPSLERMILVTSAEEFAELQPTPNPKSDNQLGENLKHFFLVSPEVASGTGLHQRMKAKDIAFGIIRNLQKLSEATGVDPVNFTAEEMTHQELLAWLWVLASKKVQELTLTTPEESQRLDELTTEAKALLDGPQEITPTLPLERVEPARSAIEEVALMTATTKLYEQYYSSELKRADEKTLLHHLSTESQKLWKMTEASILALGDNTSAIGWLFKTSRLEMHKEELGYTAHLMVARKVATLVLEANCCLASQHLAGSRNDVADLLSFWGNVRNKPNPVAFDDPPDEILTERFHSLFHDQIPQDFKVSPLPSEISSWITQVLQTAAWSSTPNKNPATKSATGPSDDGKDSAEPQAYKTTSFSLTAARPSETWSSEPFSTATEAPNGQPQETLMENVGRLWSARLCEKPQATWLRRFGSICKQAPCTSREVPTCIPPSNPSSERSTTPIHLPIDKRQSHPNSCDGCSLCVEKRHPATIQ